MPFLFYTAAAVVAVLLHRTGRRVGPARLLALVAFVADLLAAPRPAGAREIAEFLVGLLVVADGYLALRIGEKGLAPFVLILAAALRLVAEAAPDEAPLTSSAEGGPSFLVALHIAFLLAGYAALIIAALAGLLYLLQEKEIRSHRPSPWFEALPPLEDASALNRRAVRLGVILYSWGVFFGFLGFRLLPDPAVAPGDPKVVASLVLWFWAIGQFAFQTVVGFRRRRSAILSLVGASLVFVIFYGLAFTTGFRTAS